jgi:hypothetical protein
MSAALVVRCMQAKKAAQKEEQAEQPAEQPATTQAPVEMAFYRKYTE